MESSKLKIVIVFILAFLTGVNFVIFPSLGNAFTDVHVFGLSTSQFGILFLPQVIFIILSSLFAPFLVNTFGLKKILGFGLFLMLLSTGLLWLLQFQMENSSFGFSSLLVLISLMGCGFGLSITTLNPLAASFFPKSESSAILILQFLVGLGTSTAPLMMTLVGKTANWMYIPAIIFPIFSLVFLVFLSLKFENKPLFNLPKKIKIPTQLWLFFIAILFYGLIEGTLGSFGSIILKSKGFDNNLATLGLSLVWGGMATSRLLFGILSKKLNLSTIILVSTLLVGVFLYFLPTLESQNLILVFMFLIGFSMGSIFPGTIGWGTTEFPSLSVVVSGFLMAANQIGTGIVTNVLGSFNSKIALILQLLSGVTLIIFIILFYLSKKLHK